MTQLPSTLRRWTRAEYERLVDLGLLQGAALARPSMPIAVAALLP